MSDENEAESAAARLEQALERIAALAAEPPVAVANPADSGDQEASVQVDVTALSHRLDALIAHLRGALAR